MTLLGGLGRWKKDEARRKRTKLWTAAEQDGKVISWLKDQQAGKHEEEEEAFGKKRWRIWRRNMWRKWKENVEVKGGLDRRRRRWKGRETKGESNTEEIRKSRRGRRARGRGKREEDNKEEGAKRGGKQREPMTRWMWNEMKRMKALKKGAEEEWQRNNKRREKVKRQERREKEDEEVPAEKRRSNTDSKSNSAERS